MAYPFAQKVRRSSPRHLPCFEVPDCLSNGGTEPTLQTLLPAVSPFCALQRLGADIDWRGDRLRGRGCRIAAQARRRHAAQ
jgi:hypothetical protein